ncbi:hypothetical protein CA233_01695 [Sphingomonas sp. ABOLD]|nr:hypothetical protein CA233_01695 [Sphingomonas sp. ABOLD]
MGGDRVPKAVYHACGTVKTARTLVNASAGRLPGRKRDATARDGPDHPAWLTVIAVATTAAALARLFGADSPVVAAAFLAGLINTALRRTLPRLGVARPRSAP